MKFADTSWLIAWSVERDDRHAEAVGLLRSLGRAEQIVTTNLVIGESWTFLNRRVGHHAAVAFIDQVDRLRALLRIVIHQVNADDEDIAWAWLRKHDERVYSFVDATSFAVMRARRLREALAFDHDFSAAGFVEVRPSTS